MVDTETPPLQTLQRVVVKFNMRLEQLVKTAQSAPTCVAWRLCFYERPGGASRATAWDEVPWPGTGPKACSDEVTSEPNEVKVKTEGLKPVGD